jgi:hypothetical protein
MLARTGKGHSDGAYKAHKKNENGISNQFQADWLTKVPDRARWLEDLGIVMHSF